MFQCFLRHKKLPVVEFCSRRAPFGHKQSFWGKQTYCNENEYVSMLLSQVKATFGDKQASIYKILLTF